MASNLKARLRRYRASGKTPCHSVVKNNLRISSDSPWPGWEEAGFKTLKRTLKRDLPFSLPFSFPKALAILVPDFARLGRIPSPGELLFFDLETTGLSGGAGTVAFLAAFGRFSPVVKASANTPASNATAELEITQYLLLDYPGENDFVESVVREFAASPAPIAVTYNGKCFDSQILKTRCLMNGIAPPVYFHADLLHPARRLWKRLLPDCSQSTVEVSVLGLDRTGDVSGAMAPEIWFSFLRSGENGELLSVCDHNAKDVSGLASLFLSLADIAAKPLESQFRFDEEALALFWRIALKRTPLFFADDGSCAETGRTLLERAAGSGCQKASYTLLRDLAIDAEWRLRDPALALSYTESALAIPELPEGLMAELEKRQKRLMDKSAQ